MSKTAIITSFHSYSSNLTDMEPKAIVSFDSQIDDNIGGAEETQKAIDLLSFPDQSAFLRVRVHALLGFSKVLQDIPKYIVIPEGCLENRATVDGQSLEQLGVSMGDFLKTKKEFTEKFLKFKIFLCPPKNITYLFKKVKKYSTIVDFDVDYCEEFQECCYTKAPKFLYDDGSISKIGTLTDFFRTINHIRPNTVIISEIKLSQIKHPSKPFSQLLRFLKDQGYKIEYEDLVESDEIAETALKKHDCFVKEMITEERNKLVLSSNKTNSEFFDELKKADEKQADLIRKYYQV